MRLKFMATGILVERRSHAAAMLALLILLMLGVGCFAAEIRKGATVQVKPDSIWFEDAAKLTRWQELKKGGDAAALASYQEDALSERDAWQFRGWVCTARANLRWKRSRKRIVMSWLR